MTSMLRLSTHLQQNHTKSIQWPFARCVFWSLWNKLHIDRSPYSEKIHQQDQCARMLALPRETHCNTSSASLSHHVSYLKVETHPKPTRANYQRQIFLCAKLLSPALWVMKEASNKNSPAGFHAEVPRLRTHFCGPQRAESVTPTSEWNRFLRTKYSIIVFSFLYDDNVYPRKGLTQVSKHVQTMWAVEFCNAVVIQSVVDTRPFFLHA